MAEHEDLIQARRIIAGFDAQDAYTLNEADVEGARKLLQQLLDIDAQTGGYRISNVQGYKGSAQITVQFEKSPGAEACCDAAYIHADGADKLGLVLKKMIAHWNTNGDRLAKLEEFLRAQEAYNTLDSPQNLEALLLARETLG
jgi:hypothetical protein